MQEAQELTHPIFNDHDISHLARISGYSEGYLVNVKNRRAKPGKHLRHHFSLLLNRPEGELFLSE